MKNKTTENILPILAIETSGNLCSAAIITDDNIYSESSVNKKNIHSEILFELIENTLSKLKLKIIDVNSVAVSEGPGSFTGLRIGMAAAKGIADGANLPLISVPTFDALALEISAYLNNGDEFGIANKANRDEFYFSSYKNNNQTYSTTEKLKIVQSDYIGQLIFEGNKLFGNYTDNSTNEISSPSALSIARWAYFYGKDLLTFDYDYLEPNYFKNFKVKVKNEK